MAWGLLKRWRNNSTEGAAEVAALEHRRALAETGKSETKAGKEEDKEAAAKRERTRREAGRLVAFFYLVKDAAAEWQKDKVTQLGAALAYYTIFSMPPILVIAILIAGVVFGEEAASGQITKEFQGLLGSQGAQAVQAMIATAGKYQGPAAVLGIIFLLVTATSVVVQLQDSLNILWKVKPVKTDIKTTIKVRSIAVAIVLGVGFVLLVSLMINAFLSALGGAITSFIGGPQFLQYIFKALDFVVSLGIITVMFALLLKLLPHANVVWRDVWLGAFFTAVLFTIGKFVIGIYLGHSSVSTGYGTASSLAIVLVWVYYSSLIFYYGAEFTRVYANRYGSRVLPARGPVPASQAAPAR